MAFSSQSEDTRTNLLDAALVLFSTNGYDATSVAEICQKAQASKGAFYYHFPSKQDLFLTLMGRWLADMDDTLKNAGQNAGSIPQALDQMAGASGAVFNALEAGFPILLEFWTQASRQPVIWEKVVEPYRHYLGYFAEVIALGIDEGSFDPDIDPECGARLLMAVAMGLLLQASFDPQGADWHQITRSGVNILLKGLRRST